VRRRAPGRCARLLAVALLALLVGSTVLAGPASAAPRGHGPASHGHTHARKHGHTVRTHSGHHRHSGHHGQGKAVRQRRAGGSTVTRRTAAVRAAGKHGNGVRKPLGNRSAARATHPAPVRAHRAAPGTARAQAGARGASAVQHQTAAVALVRTHVAVAGGHHASSTRPAATPRRQPAPARTRHRADALPPVVGPALTPLRTLGRGITAVTGWSAFSGPLGWLFTALLLLALTMITSALTTGRRRAAHQDSQHAASGETPADLAAAVDGGTSG
jgi:hypothetical protein